jgi:hypothetical protein
MAFALLREETAKTLDAQAAQEATLRRTLPVEVEDVLVDGGESIWQADIAPSKMTGETDWDAVYREARNPITSRAVEHSEFGQQHVKVEAEADEVVEDLWELLTIDSRFPGTQALPWPANTGPDLVRHNLPPQSLWSYDRAREKSLRRRHTAKKLVVQEVSISLLLQKILHEPCVRDLAEAHRERKLSHHIVQTISDDIKEFWQLNSHEISLYTSELRQGLRTLQQASPAALDEVVLYVKSRVDRSIPLPSYYQDRDGDFYATARQMNDALQWIFSLAQGGRRGGRPDNAREEAIALTKIAHNLLVSPAPPDVQTFNILINNFKRWNLPILVDATISALYRCKIRPNELTCAAILDHYTQQNQPESFSMFVAKMRGLAKGIMLARPDININQAGGGRLVRVDEDKVIQKVHPTPMVFNALMLGVLKFAGIERAIEIYYEMKEDGWGLDVFSLTKFLTACIRESDWHNGLYVWQEISNIKSRAEKSHVTRAYAHMLSLCTVTGNTSAYNQILQEVARQNMDGKRILQSAMSLTQKVPRASSRSIPPWAADNVLIAAMAFKDDVKSSGSSPGSQADDMAEAWIRAEAEAEAGASSGGERAPDVEIPPPLDPDAAWAAWMAHEFREKK